MARTLNILSIYRMLHGDHNPPTVSRYKEIEQIYGDPSLPERGERSIYDLCFKPKKSTDLMLIGRKGAFQATMNQKPIVIKKFPTSKAEDLIEDLLDNVEIPKLFFGRKGDGKPEWKIKRLHWIRTPETEYLKEITPEEWSKYKKDPVENPLEICHDLVNIVLNFHPSTSLKAIGKYELGLDVNEFNFPLPTPTEFGYHPIGGEYDNLEGWINVWATDPQQRKYADFDTVLTEEVYNYMVCHEQGLEWVEGMDLSGYDLEADRTDSELATLVGNCYWSGYPIDRDLVNKLYDKCRSVDEEYSKEVAYNSRGKVMAYLTDVANPFLKKLITGTSKEVLDFLRKEDGEIGRRAQLVYDARRNKLELGLLEKLKKAGRLHVSFKVVGTKSNRMAGGSLEGKGQTINPQGIKKDSDIRACFTFKDHGKTLCGGDFSGFEISIMEAVYNDEKLREDLMSGKKIHAIWGSFLYSPMTYDDIMATQDLNADHPDGYYSRSKNSIFAEAYGAAIPKLCELTGLSEEQMEQAKEHFGSTYQGVGRAKFKILDDHQAMVQKGGIGSRIEWAEPQRYVESFLGFRRYFTMEYNVIKALYDLATDLPSKYKSARKIQRGQRRQSLTGGCKSAIYAGAFGLQSGIIRAAGNHQIQSPGGQMTKELEHEIWGLQPVGIHPFSVKPFNVHDELQVAVDHHLVNELERIKDSYIEYRKKVVPLITMDWKRDCASWKESH